MTPQERQLMVQLFDRLATLENSPRDPDAEAMIREGFRRAPNSAYALVQTVLLQDEALKVANAHIQELEQLNGGPPQPQGQPRGFLDSMRENLFGRDEPRSPVPRVPLGAPSSRPDPWGQQQGYQGQTYQNQAGYPNQGAPMQAPPQQGGGGSFLGTAAAAAAGVIGGSLLMGGIRSAMGAGHHASSPAAGALDSLSGKDSGSPWSGSAAGSDLSRDAGLNDIGASRSGFGGSDQARPAGLFDSAQNDSEGDAGYDDSGDDSDAGFDDGDSDTA